MGLLDYFGFRSEGAGSSDLVGLAFKGLNKFREIVSIPFKWLGRKATQDRIEGRGGSVAEFVSDKQNLYFPEDFHQQVEEAVPVITSLSGLKTR